jgi:ectoine hydroxylase-related dioxygenase (phytanoyl-CoA dioxygenase family)
MSTVFAPHLLHTLQTSFDRDGFCIAQGLISSDEVSLIRDSFMQMNLNGPVEGLSEIAHTRVDGNVAGYDKTDPLSLYPRMMQPHLHPDKPVGPIAKRYLLDARILSVLSTLMRESPYAVQTMFYFKPPGARGQDFHQDNYYLRVKPGTCMAAWIAIDDCDAENGGMMCVPETGTHSIQCPEKADPRLYFTTEHVAIPQGKTAVLPLMKAGDVLFFNGSTIHGSGPNTSTTRFRRSLICHYVPQSTTEMSHWYKVFDASGAPVPIKVNEDGGPCGTTHAEPQKPH